jgi:hypothetical protein
VKNVREVTALLSREAGGTAQRETAAKPKSVRRPAARKARATRGKKRGR